MRPLIVLTGQGIARGDGFNLTRRAKALEELRPFVDCVERSDRQNLDALLATAFASNSIPAAKIVSGLRRLCLKERRSTLRKAAHRRIFQALAEVGRERPVVHLTASLDGLSTTFLVRDFGGSWAPFHESCSLAQIHDDVRAVLSARRGLLHFPLHGEVGLYVSESPDERLRTAYHHPATDPDGVSWISSLVLGPGRGLRDVEDRLPSSRVALALLEALLLGSAVQLGDGTRLDPLPAAELLAIGYGAHDRGERTSYPFERTIHRLRETKPTLGPGHWRALVHRPSENKRVASWYEMHGFGVVAYADDDLAERTVELLETSRTSGCCAPETTKRVANAGS